MGVVFIKLSPQRMEFVLQKLLVGMYLEAIIMAKISRMWRF